MNKERRATENLFANLSDNPNNVCKHRNRLVVREEVKCVMTASSV
jgi:hypothetical protein